MKTFKKLNNGFIIRFLIVIEMKIYFYSALSYVINVMDFSTPFAYIKERFVNVHGQGLIKRWNFVFSGKRVVKLKMQTAKYIFK